MVLPANRLSIFALGVLFVFHCNGWVQTRCYAGCHKLSRTLLMRTDNSLDETRTRRAFIERATTGMFILCTSPSPSDAVTRAIGGAEEECRAVGNCLEMGELDGALGWSWGGKDRCDASNPLCGSDGKLREEVLAAETIPEMTNKVTHLVDLSYTVGRREVGTIRLGLYGEDAEKSVDQFLQFVTRGLRTTSDLAFQNSVGVQSIPVSLTQGGILGQIVPGQRIDFGVPMQSAAYARQRGISKVPENFKAQPRPKPIEESALRPHIFAGLLSIPGKGIGYGGSGFETDDECFESSFQITSASLPSMDKKEGRRVIGQVMDQESMNNLTRLASLPTKKGFKGVIPGQTSGPPLLKVAITDVNVFPVEPKA